MKIYHFLILIIFPILWNIKFAVGQEEPSFKVMSYNIRYDNKTDSPNWDQRKKHVVSLVIFHDAGLLGIQEGLKNQLDDMNKGMSGYKWVGKGRDDGSDKGEFSAIFYKTDLFELLESETFWLSETPGKPSKSWDAALPRVCTWAKLKFKPTNSTFYMFNTHFDHIGVEARLNSVKLLKEKIPQIAGTSPFILTGDFNFPPDSEPYKILTSSSEILDAKETSQTGHYGPEGSFNAFKFHEPLGQKIDYIFTNNKLNVLRHGILSDSYEMNYPSDHLPVLAEVQFKDNLGSLKWTNEFMAFDEEEKERSYTVFTGSSSIKLWPELKKNFKKNNILNRGFGGSEIQDLLNNTDRLIFRYAPKRVIIYSGDNDIWSGKTPDRVAEDFKNLYNEINTRLPETEIYFISIKPSPSRVNKFEDIKNVNNQVKEFLEKQDRGIYVDVYSHMLDEQGNPREDLFVADRLHLNAKGYDLWNKILMPYLN
ncbi:hypothetical protein BH23BAC1_BH23BAC1_07930 [soil metagenome]